MDFITISSIEGSTLDYEIGLELIHILVMQFVQGVHTQEWYTFPCQLQC